MSNQDKKKDWGKLKEEFEAQAEQELNEELAEELPVSDNFKSASALEHPSYVALEEQLTLAEQKAHENWEKSVRAMAELDNVRRRMEREVSNAHKYGAEKLISSLLPIIDSLEQALQLAQGNSDAGMSEGLQLTIKLFIDVLEKFDVTQLDPVGEVFNPQEHEAMAMQAVPDVAPNTVISVFQKGYKLSDRVVRAARVIVAKSS